MFAFLPKDKYKRRCTNVRDCIERVQRCAIKKQTSSLNVGSSILGRIKSTIMLDAHGTEVFRTIISSLIAL